MNNVVSIETHPLWHARLLLRMWEFLTRHGVTDEALDAWDLHLQRLRDRYGDGMVDKSLTLAMQLQDAEEANGGSS